MACSSAADSLPAPGRSLSMTYFDMGRLHFCAEGSAAWARVSDWADAENGTARQHNDSAHAPGIAFKDIFMVGLLCEGAAQVTGPEREPIYARRFEICAKRLDRCVARSARFTRGRGREITGAL